MINLKHFTIFILFAITLICSAANMADKLLPTARFGGWFSIRDESSDKHINQIWRTTLSSPIRNVQGSVVVSYRAEDAASENIALSKTSDFISRRRFTDYIAKGYEVIPMPWNTSDGFGAVFNISGITHGETDIYNQAKIYALGLTRGTSVITLEIRLSVSGENSGELKKALEKNDITLLSNELAKFIIPLWQQNIVDIPNEPIRTPMKTENPEVPIIPKNVEPEIIEVDPVIYIDPEPEPEKNLKTPQKAEENRWYTIDHHLSIVIPPSWKYTGNDKQSTWINTATSSSLRIYSAEIYDTNADLACAIDDFAVSQKAICLRKFEQTPFAVDDSLGVLVRYTNYSKNTTQSYLFGKSNRIWRIDLNISGENAPLTDDIKNMIMSVKAD